MPSRPRGDDAQVACSRPCQGGALHLVSAPFGTPFLGPLQDAVVAQLVRAPVCGTGGRWFEPTQLYQQKQWFSAYPNRSPPNWAVVGLISRSTLSPECASLCIGINLTDAINKNTMHVVQSLRQPCMLYRPRFVVTLAALLSGRRGSSGGDRV